MVRPTAVALLVLAFGILASDPAAASPPGYPQLTARSRGPFADDLVVVDISMVPPSSAWDLSKAVPGHDEEINAGTEQLVLPLSAVAYLGSLGFDVEALRPAELPGPGWPRCYRSIDEVYDSVAGYADSYPDLVELIDIGDSHCKKQGNCVTTAGDRILGRDIFVLRLTNEHASTPKQGRLWVDGGLHARELPTVELMLTMVEHLLDGYGSDAQLTYLLDHRELHIGVMVNPDGRTLVEMGTRKPYEASPWYWRKNANSIRADRCSWPPDILNHYGVDLNRNHTYSWNAPGHSTNPCAETYHGPSPASEAEAQAYEEYLRAIFPDQRGPDPDDAAPLETTGMMLNFHNATVPGIVLVPWGWSRSPTRNHVGLEEIARRYVADNGYDVSHALYPASGSTRDWAYGELGIPAYVVELEGAGFFTPCHLVPMVVGHHVQPILMSLGLSDRPYERIRGPEVMSIDLTDSVPSGEPLAVRAGLDESRAGADAIAGAEVTLGREGGRADGAAPPQPGAPTGAGISMRAVDGSFDTPQETAAAEVDTSDLAPGRYYTAVRGRDTHGHWGPMSTRFVTITEAVPQLGLRLSAPEAVTAGDRLTYTLTVTAARNTAPSVTVKDRLPEGVTYLDSSDGAAVSDREVSWSLGDMQDGEGRHLTLVVGTTAAEVESMVVNSEYSARFEGGPTVTGPAIKTRVVPLPLLTVVKHGPGAVIGGDVITYTLNVSVAQGPAHDVVVTDHIPPTTRFRSASHDAEHSDGMVTWRLGRLNAEDRVRLELIVDSAPTAVERWVSNAYAARHARGPGGHGPPVVTRVRSASLLYVPLIDR